MSRARMPRLTPSACVLAGIMALTTPSLGQLGAGAPSGAQDDAASNIIRPERAETPGPSPRWLYYLIMGALGVGAIGVGIMPSQRTHQD